MWPTSGIRGASLHSIATGTGFAAWYGLSQGTHPLSSTRRRGSCKVTASCLAMSLYRVALMSLASRMHERIPKALQPWYCDDACVAGKVMPSARCLDFLVKFGPQYGYFPKPGKFYYICKAKDKDTAHQAFESFGLDINYSRGQRYLGGFIGSAEKKGEWLVGMVEKQAATVVTLSTVAERYPQTPYAGLPSACRMNGSMPSK